MKLYSYYPTAQFKNQPAVVNWRENDLNDQLFYSYRQTEYDPESYPAVLHYHDYYELVVFEEGDIRYLCGSETFDPHLGDVILIPPGSLHMSMMKSERTRYTRHVFYLYPEAFDSIGCPQLTTFLKKTSAGQMLTANWHQEGQELSSLLPKLNDALLSSPGTQERALALGYAIQIFYLFNRLQYDATPHRMLLPQSVLEIQKYLDEHFADISSVHEVAEHFFYSREYVSRLFQKHFHTTVADYLAKRRIAYSQALIQHGYPLGEAGLQAGFANINTFIRTFRSVTGLTPSEYRRTI